MRFGVSLPGPFWASFNIPQGGHRGRRTSGNDGCLTVLLILCFLPLYLIFKAYQFAWGKPQTQRGKILSVCGVSVGLLILLIVGSAAGGGSSSPTPRRPSPVGSAASVLAQVTPTPSATHKAVAASKSPAPVTASAVASSSSPAPVRTTRAPATTAPVTITPPTTAAPPTAAPATPSCYPLSSSGNCYRPGEFCPAKYHDMSGVAADGKSINCEDVNGWRWE